MTGTDRVLGASLFDVAGVRADVDNRLAVLLEGKARAAAEHRLPGELVEVLHEFLFADGKRIRPLLCVIGRQAADGEGPAGPVVRAAARLEMFHAFPLVHDDLMDESDTRRGRLTARRAPAARHTGRADASRLGAGADAAILLGDLAPAWSRELLHTAGLAPHQPTDALTVFDTMRTELVHGQYLDLPATGGPTTDIGRALAIARRKTTKYAVECPQHLGAAPAVVGTSLRVALSAFAVPVGAAFRLRDDLLGTFGDPAVTGTPRLDDPRAGRDTTLVVLAMKRADPAQRRTSRALIGNRALEENNTGRVRRTWKPQAPAPPWNTSFRTGTTRCGVLRRASLPPAVTAALLEIASAATVRTT